jgi:cytoskeletal protein CcmA (bactofilin family)
MFKKQNDKLESLIGFNSDFKGEVNVSGTLRIDGKFTGNVNSGWIVVGEQAVVKGDLHAKGVVVGGKVEGNIKADDLVELKPTAHLFGDIYSTKLVIAEGGIFMGRSISQGNETRLIDFSDEEVTLR